MRRLRCSQNEIENLDYHPLRRHLWGFDKACNLFCSLDLDRVSDELSSICSLSALITVISYVGLLSYKYVNLEAGLRLAKQPRLLGTAFFAFETYET